MSAVRRHLSWIACAWLVCQISALIAAPLVIAGEELCTCPTDTPGAACPLHHAHQNSDECVLRSASPAPAFTLASLIGTVGVIPPTEPSSGIIVSEPILPFSADVIARSDRPDSPPRS